MKKNHTKLPIPEYLKKESEVDELPDYEWDCDNHRNYWSRGVPALENKIGKCANRAVVTFSAGIAEWVAWRFTKYPKVSSLFNCIEAVYASVIDWSYFNATGSPIIRGKKINWGKDSVEGPINVAQYLLRESIKRASREQYVADIPVFLSRLVEHVCSHDIKPFRKWRNEVIVRLQEIEPLDLNNQNGSTLPKEILDPDIKLKPEVTKELIEKFLNSLDHKSNPYLNSPEKMLKAGFEGTPYEL